MSSTRSPAWVHLPADLWRRILLAAADASLDETPTTQGTQGQAFHPWVLWTRVMASVSTVCRSLRDAVLGPNAGRLWTRLRFSSCFPGLSTQQSQGLNRLQMGRCQNVTSLRQVSIWGGCWAPEELHEICALLPGQLHLLDLRNIADAAEAAVIGAALAGASVKQLFFHGSAPFIYPVSPQVLWIRGSFQPMSSLTSTAQTFAQQAFTQLLRVNSLHTLVFHVDAWILTAHNVQLLQQHLPRLQKLQVILFSYPTVEGPSQQAVHSLKILSAVQVHVCAYGVDSSCLQHLLQQLLEVPLHSLQLAECRGGISPAAEALLAALHDCQKLTLRFWDPARRLKVAPAGMRVAYAGQRTQNACRPMIL